MDERRELNTITVAVHTMLLTRTGGVAVHFTQSAGDEDDAQPAIPTHWQPTTTWSNFAPAGDLDELLC